MIYLVRRVRTRSVKFGIAISIPALPPSGDDVPAGDSELVVELEVPDGVSEEEVMAAVGELVGMADELHRCLGGRGLKVARDLGHHALTRR